MTVQSYLYRCASSRCNISHQASRQSLFGGFEGQNERVARLHLARIVQVPAAMMPTETVHFVQVVIVIGRRIECRNKIRRNLIFSRFGAVVGQEIITIIGIWLRVRRIASLLLHETGPRANINRREPMVHVGTSWRSSVAIR